MHEALNYLMRFAGFSEVYGKIVCGWVCARVSSENLSKLGTNPTDITFKSRKKYLFIFKYFI